MERLEQMPEDLRRVAIGALIVSLVAGLSSSLLFLAAFQFRLDWFAEPARLVAGGTASAILLRWAAILDLIGYYLATAALAYALWRRLRPRNPTVADLSLLGALAYAAAGGVGASVLAMVGPMLMGRYAASPEAAGLAEAQFAFLFETVVRGIWQLFDGIGLVVWWIGLGILLRGDREGLARLSFVLAVAGIVGVLFNVLGFGVLRDAALVLIFPMWTAWWIWLLLILRRAP